MSIDRNAVAGGDLVVAATNDEPIGVAWKAAASLCGAEFARFGTPATTERRPCAVVACATSASDSRIGELVEACASTAALVVVTDGSTEEGLWRRVAWDTASANCDTAAAAETLGSALEESARRLRDCELVDDYSRRIATLSDNEKRVFEMICRGRLNKQIAVDLSVSVRTIEQRRRRVFDKMGVESAAPLAALWATVQTLQDQAHRVRRDRDDVSAVSKHHHRRSPGQAPSRSAIDWSFFACESDSPRCPQ